METETTQRQLNVRSDPQLYRVLEAVAGDERRTVPQAAQELIEEGLRHRPTQGVTPDDITSPNPAALVTAGGAFDWRDAEPELDDDTRGEPL